MTSALSQGSDAAIATKLFVRACLNEFVEQSKTKSKRRKAMPATKTETKKVVVTIAGDPDDRLYEVDVEAGATPASVFEAIGLEKGPNNRFAYQLSKPGNGGVFRENDNVFGNVKDGDKLEAVPKSPVAVS